MTALVSIDPKTGVLKRYGRGLNKRVICQSVAIMPGWHDTDHSLRLFEKSDIEDFRMNRLPVPENNAA